MATCRLHQEDPAFRDNVLFYEHFHGDTGRGLGASHQTGWSALVALLIDRVHAKSPAGKSRVGKSRVGKSPPD